MRKFYETTLFLAAFLLTATAAWGQGPAFADGTQHYEFVDGKTVIRMNCSAVTENPRNGYGRCYKTVIHVASGKKENFFQGVIRKDTFRQISAKRTSKAVFLDYVWDGDRIIRHDMKNETRMDIANDNTVDLCGLIYQIRSGVPAAVLETETLLVEGDTLPLSAVEYHEDGETFMCSMQVGDQYHVSGRIRKDDDRTPEHLDIHIPGFSAKASLLEHRTSSRK